MTEQTKNLPAVPEVKVTFTPAVINVNFDELKSSLSAQIDEQSNTVITVDNMGEGKTLMASMNKVAEAIDKARKEYAKEAGVNIATFESQMKDLVTIVKNGVAKIKSQVETFETETKKDIQILLGETLGREWDALDIPAEFRRSHINDLILLGSITAKGNLTAKAAAEIKARASADKAAADRVKIRLLELENQSYRAGLSIPLTRAHVQPFLEMPDEHYQQNLDQIIASELQRQKDQEEAIRAKVLQDQQRDNLALQQANENARLVNERADKAERERLEAQHAAAAAVNNQPTQEQRPVGSGGGLSPTKFAYADMLNPDGIKHKYAFAANIGQIAQIAADDLKSAKQIGIWTKQNGLIAIMFGGALFLRQ